MRGLVFPIAASAILAIAPHSSCVDAAAVNRTADLCGCEDAGSIPQPFPDMPLTTLQRLGDYLLEKAGLSKEDAECLVCPSCSPDPAGYVNRPWLFNAFDMPKYSRRFPSNYGS